MTDVFNEILKAYKIALMGLSVPAYAAVIPQDAPKTYILYQPIYSLAAEAKTCSGQDAVMQVSIISANPTGSFSEINLIASEVFSRIYPNPGSVLPGTKNIFTRVSQDMVITLSLQPNVQMQRVIHFSHNF